MNVRSPVYALGHSNRTLEFFVGLLLGYGVQRLVDVRTIPRSFHNPQFNKDSLPNDLRSVGIRYRHMPGLGGRRRPLPHSINQGWTHPSFRGYADYMQTPAFEKSLDELIAMTRTETVAFMCAEAVPWRCHRSLIADALTIRKIPVHQIMSRVSAPVHEITSFAVVKGNKIIYPPKQQELFASRE
jgi:uncharacterized protein (DUF488 family)